MAGPNVMVRFSSFFDIGRLDSLGLVARELGFGPMASGHRLGRAELFCSWPRAALKKALQRVFSWASLRRPTAGKDERGGLHSRRRSRPYKLASQSK